MIYQRAKILLKEHISIQSLFARCTYVPIWLGACDCIYVHIGILGGVDVDFFSSDWGLLQDHRSERPPDKEEPFSKREWS